MCYFKEKDISSQWIEYVHCFKELSLGFNLKWFESNIGISQQKSILNSNQPKLYWKDVWIKNIYPAFKHY